MVASFVFRSDAELHSFNFEIEDIFLQAMFKHEGLVSKCR